MQVLPQCELRPPSMFSSSSDSSKLRLGPPPSFLQLRSSTRSALAIPEILLLIFSFSIPLASNAHSPDLPNFAVVNKAWSAIAQSLLYSNLKLTWRYSYVKRLLESFGSNPSLRNLTHSCSIEGFGASALWAEQKDIVRASEEYGWELESLGYGSELEVEEINDSQEYVRVISALTQFGTIVVGAHEDQRWLRDSESNGLAALVDFLGTLKSLRSLQIKLRTTVVRSEISAAQWGELDVVLGHLTSLRLTSVGSSVSQRLVTGAANVFDLALVGGSAHISSPPLSRLRRLCLETVLVDVHAQMEPPGEIDYYETLETLELGRQYFKSQYLLSAKCCLVPLFLQPVEKVFSVLDRLKLYLSHRCLAQDINCVKTLLLSAPRLRHFELVPGCAALAALVPFLSLTLASITVYGQDSERFVLSKEEWFSTFRSVFDRFGTNTSLCLVGWPELMHAQLKADAQRFGLRLILHEV